MHKERWKTVDRPIRLLSWVLAAVVVLGVVAFVVIAQEMTTEGYDRVVEYIYCHALGDCFRVNRDNQSNEGVVNEEWGMLKQVEYVFIGLKTTNSNLLPDGEEVNCSQLVDRYNKTVDKYGYDRCFKVEVGLNQTLEEQAQFIIQ